MNKIIHGDCLKELKKLPKNSVDLLCTDPPYGYSFMGKDWDKAVPSVEVWQECLRVLKPGAFAFIMSAPRSDVLSRMIVRIEDAGFRVDFSPIYWTYASGFPKAMNIGKMVDKRNGTKREVLPPKQFADGTTQRQTARAGIYSEEKGQAKNTRGTSPLEGSYGGFQPKPAVEVVIVAMKPLSEKTYVDQAMKNGKGVTWLTPDCAIPSEERDNTPMGSPAASYGGFVAKTPTTTTRFPANLLVQDNVLADYSRYFDLDAWAKTLPFLITPKASKGEKNEGLGAISEKQVMGGGGVNSPAASAYGAVKAKQSNSHPTVKPLKLMAYLITLGSRHGDVVLEPFAGSGTTCLAAKNLGRTYIGIEREAEYVKIAEARLKNSAPVQPTLMAAE